MKFIFLTILLACFLSSCVLTELTTRIGEHTPEEIALASHTPEGEYKKTKHFLDWSERRRELWAYPVIVILLPLAATMDILIDIYDSSNWIVSAFKD